jgi:hypothetical protein
LIFFDFFWLLFFWIFLDFCDLHGPEIFSRRRNTFKYLQWYENMVIGNHLHSAGGMVQIFGLNFYVSPFNSDVLQALQTAAVGEKSQ